MLEVGPSIAEHRRRSPWLADHPHLNAHAVPGNTIYVGTDELSIGSHRLGVPGAGAFARCHDGLRLSAPGRTRSVWDLPGWMLLPTGPTLSYHRDPGRWSRPSTGRAQLRTVAQGQEFVLDCAVRLPSLQDWLGTLFKQVPANLTPACAADTIALSRSTP